MVRKLFVLLVFTFIIPLFLAENVFAGFGITPPYVRNSSLTRNSTYEQQILLVRSDPTSPLKATISIDAPEIEDWIEIVEGNTIALPKGEQKVPMTVRIKVPSNADFKQYDGTIRIKTGKPDDSVSSGAVSISLGAQVDIGISVIDKEIKDFRVRRIGISDLNEGHSFGWLYFPGKINFKMSLENTGNVNVAPSKVVFRIFDTSGKVLLEEIENTNRIKKIEPYATEEVIAELPTRLPAGSYLARYQIYNDEELKQEGELTLSILPYGTLQTAGYGFMGLSIPHKLSLLLPLFTMILIIGSILYTRQQRRRPKNLK